MACNEPFKQNRLLKKRGINNIQSFRLHFDNQPNENQNLNDSKRELSSIKIEVENDYESFPVLLSDESILADKEIKPGQEISIASKRPLIKTLGNGQYGCVDELEDSKTARKRPYSDNKSKMQIKNEISVLKHISKHNNENIVKLIGYSDQEV